jgi:hypothetical protein
MTKRILISAIVGITVGLLVIGGLALQANHDNPAAPVQAAGTRPLVVIYMENHERSSIVSSTSAPYMNQLRNQGKDFTHYYGVTHPSLPNYLALGNGSTNGKQGTDSISAGEISGTTVWNQLAGAGINFNVYEESMPSVCYGGGSSGQYQLKHNPATPFHDVFTNNTVCSHVKPYPGPGAPLAAMNFVAPNMCNDMHDCSIATGNGWLQANVPPMLSQGAKVIITFDEGSTSDHGGGNIYTVEYYNGITPVDKTATYNHYSLLKAIEMKFGLTPLNSAASATKLPIG